VRGEKGDNGDRPLLNGPGGAESRGGGRSAAVRIQWLVQDRGGGDTDVWVLLQWCPTRSNGSTHSNRFKSFQMI
jgi:hypothetical protein